MRPTLPDGDALDGCFTHRARLSRPPVNPEMVLKVSTAINPIYAGTIPANALLQHLPDRMP